MSVMMLLLPILLIVLFKILFPWFILLISPWKCSCSIVGLIKKTQIITSSTEKKYTVGGTQFNPEIHTQEYICDLELKLIIDRLEKLSLYGGYKNNFFRK